VAVREAGLPGVAVRHVARERHHSVHVAVAVGLAVALQLQVVLHRGRARWRHDHRLGLAAQQVGHVGAEVLRDQLHLLADVGGVQAQPPRQRASGGLLVDPAVGRLLELRAQPQRGGVTRVVAQHVEDEALTLQHSLVVQRLLLDRIRSPQGFHGAMYEVRVAASLLRAGFTLELEDETDRRQTHVEFVATHQASGTRFAVEAKRREGAKLKVNKLLYSALTKRADHVRLVFIDTNDGRLDTHKYEQLPMPLAEVRQLLKLYAMDPAGRALPAAYVIATWAPEEHHLDDAGLPMGTLLLGFGIEDLAPGYRSLLEQVQIRRRHQPVFDLLESMQRHSVIPATYDGEAAAFVSGAPPNKLKVGEWFEVAGPDGQPIKGFLESGTVVVEQKAAWCVFRCEDGRRSISTVPLTDVELDAFKQHPATFFGTIDRNAGRPPMKTAMDWFGFLWESYKATPKERLLQFMAAAPDIADLAQLNQFDLATTYSVRMAETLMRRDAGKP
jgi:hypothetical protein